MTVRISIRETACRGCSLCSDICPTLVFKLDEETKLMKVAVADDCIACLSCAYLCPSTAISHFDFPQVKDFSRNTDTLRDLVRYL